jgi:hypothetical protein
MAIQQKPTLRDSKAAIDWYQEKMQSAAGGVRAKLLRAEESQTGSTVLGKMYFFRYDPKWKAVLPIYDIYPLVFPIERYNDGFLGLNIHYLSVPERQSFVNQLSQYATAKNLTPNSRLRMTYGLLMDSKKLATPARPCIKRYLWNHVRTKFIEIPATEWDRAAILPIELFVVKK